MLPQYLKLISLLYKLYLPLSSNDDNIVGQHPPTNKVAGEDENLHQQTRLLVKKKHQATNNVVGDKETPSSKQCCWG